jgi:chemotaxis protein histidine kinase CheA
VIRKNLDRINGQPDTDALQAIQDEVNILSGAAEMLELAPVMDLLSPFSKALDEVTQDGWRFTGETQQTILSYVDDLEQCFARLGALPPAAPEEGPVPEIVFPDLPPELAEIFSLEAQEHIQTIQSGMELLRKSPGDQALMADLRRATHTLKGAAGAVGYDAIASTAHLMEDLVEYHLDGGTELTSEGIALLLDTTDLIECLFDPARIGEARTMMAQTLGRYPAPTCCGSPSKTLMS